MWFFLNFFFLCLAGVIHFYENEQDITSLDQWEREYFLYTKVDFLLFVKFYLLIDILNDLVFDVLPLLFPSSVDFFVYFYSFVYFNSFCVTLYFDSFICVFVFLDDGDSILQTFSCVESILFLEAMDSTK